MIETQYDKYTRDQLVSLAKAAAMFKLIGAYYSGHIGEQTVRVNEDGSVEVFTPHQRAPLIPITPSSKRKRKYTKREKNDGEKTQEGKV